MRTLLKCAVVGLVSWLATSCGDSDGYGDKPSPPAPQPTGDKAWDAVADVVARNCAKCHNGSNQPLLGPKATFLASPVKAKVSAGLMPPPPATLTDADKKILLDYAQK